MGKKATKLEARNSFGIFHAHGRDQFEPPSVAAFLECTVAERWAETELGLEPGTLIEHANNLSCILTALPNSLPQLIILYVNLAETLCPDTWPSFTLDVSVKVFVHEINM